VAEAHGSNRAMARVSPLTRLVLGTETMEAIGGSTERGVVDEWELRLVVAQDVPAVSGGAFGPHETARATGTGQAARYRPRRPAYWRTPAE